MKKLFRIIIFCILIFIRSRQDIYAQPFLNDSLKIYLEHFHEKTIDNDFKKTVEKTQALFTTNRLNDSLISNLINAEDQLVTLIQENQLLNFKPFKREIVFSFGEKLVSLFQQLPPNNESLYYASALNNLGALYSSFGQWQDGNVLIEKAFNMRKKYLSEEHPDYAESLLNMAMVYGGRGKKEQTLEFAKKTLILTKKEGIKFQVTHANCLFFLADMYTGTFQYVKAAQLFEEELNERKKILGEQNAHYALRLYRTADMFQYMWQFDKSILFLTQALDLTKKTLGDASLQFAYCLDNLGGAYYSLAEYKRAVPLYVQSLAIKERLFGKAYSDNSISLHNLATTYQQMGDYARAIPLAQDALEISKRALAQGLEFDSNYAFGLNYLASLYQAMGQYSEALSLLQNALALTKNTIGEETPYYARALNSLAVLYENMHRFDSALYYYQNILKLRQKILWKADPEYASSLDNLSRLYKKMGKYDIAIRLCRQGLEVRKTSFGDSSPACAASLNNLGELYMQKGKYDTASVLLNQSLNIRKKVLGDSHPDYAKSLYSLGLLNVASGNNINAAMLITEANKIELKYIRYSYTSLSELEKLNLVNKEYLLFSYLPSLLYKNSKMSPAILQQVYRNEIDLKGMVLDDQKETLKRIRQSGDSLVLRQFQQWRSNKASLGNQLLLPVADRISNLDSLRETTNQLEQQLSRSSAAFLNQQQNHSITTSDISNKLSKGEAAIEFIKFQLYHKKWTDSIMYAALILLPGDTVPKFVPLFEERKLKDLLQKNATVNQRYPLSNNLSNSTAKRNSLFNLIWKPLEKYLAGVNTVSYAPTGLLHRIAFQALSYDSSRLLIDRYQLNQLLNTVSLVSPLQTTKPGSINLWGDIQYDFKTNNFNSKTYAGTQNGRDTKPDPHITSASTFNFNTADTKYSRGGKFGKLLCTKLEIENINDMFLNNGTNATIMSDTVATEEAFKTLDGKSPPILHLATHGFFLPVRENKSESNTAGKAFTMQENPMFRSGLVLAGGNPTWKGEQPTPGKEDGILTAYEIAQMDLSSTDLAVLSACKTALGDLNGNEGVIGLQRAFKMAGVKQLIMTLWEINDEQTTELMTLFYKNWLGGQSTKEALRSAQLKIKEKYPSPFYWAGFVLVE